MHKVAYLGYSEAMLEYLLNSDYFELVLTIGVRGRMSKEYYILVERYGVNYIEVEEKKEFLYKFCRLDDIDVFLMYKFEYILPQDLVLTRKVINFHGGDLQTNRGAHAVVWSVLLEEKNTCLSCYELTGGIDEGYLIDTYKIQIGDWDTPNIVNQNLAKGIPVLLHSVELYLEGKKEAKLVKGGMYRNKITEKDYTIDLESDFIRTMKAKILSQQSYNGAIVKYDGAIYFIKDFTIEKYESRQGRIISKTDREIIVCEGGERLRMSLCRRDNEALDKLQ